MYAPRRCNDRGRSGRGARPPSASVYPWNMRGEVSGEQWSSCDRTSRDKRNTRETPWNGSGGAGSLSSLAVFRTGGWLDRGRAVSVRTFVTRNARRDMPKQPRLVLATAELSRNPDPAIVSAARMSALTRSALHVLHCVPAGASAEVIHTAGASLRQQTPPGASVTMVSGAAHDEIAVEAARSAADIVMLGPRRDPAAAGRLGRTADRVLRATRVPCLLANAELPEDAARILLAVDWSDPGEIFHGA
jgi:nucleotide-binding universal stress UspA family protein